MSFASDYPGAIVVEAANYGYGTPNRPKTWGFHTPEEIADDDPQTPGYLAGTTRLASYTYFVSSAYALVFQLVPESEGAYAHYLNGKPEPSWSDGTSLNLQSLSLSFEGMAATIHLTMPRGCPQWKAGVDLVAHRTIALGLNLDWAFGHKDVSVQRGDPGQFDQDAFIADVRTRMEEMMAMSAQDWIAVRAEMAEMKAYLVERDDAQHRSAQGTAWQVGNRVLDQSRADLAAHKGESHGGGDGLKRGDTVMLS